MKYYIIYQITNLVNNKYYVGAHQTVNLDDTYMSSSQSVKSAMKKYGKSQFLKEILHFCNSEEEMYLKESEIVTDEFVGRIDTYNIKLGGYGGWTHYHGSDQHLASCKTGGRARKDSMPSGIPFEKGSERAKEASKKGNLALKKMYENTPERRVFTSAKIATYQTENNSMSGKCWCVPIGSLHTSERKVFATNSIPDGWIRCTEHNDLKKRKSGVYGRYWIHDPVAQKNKYHQGAVIPDGWFKGRKKEYYQRDVD